MEQRIEAHAQIQIASQNLNGVPHPLFCKGAGFDFFFLRATNSSNQLTAMTGSTFTSDNNGNTLTKVVGSNTTTYAWDFENRLTSVTLPASGGTVAFAYDPFGRRIKKVVSSTSTTSIFAYDGDNLIEETNSSGAAVARYSQGLNIDEPLAMLRSSATSYYNADGLGTVTSLANASGTLAQTYTFDSFGKQTASSGSLTNSFQYTARESDPETGLYYYRARYYDPTTGRFLHEDPFGFGGGVDFYAYVGNSPASYSDPFGEEKKNCCAVRLPADPDASILARLIFAEATDKNISDDASHEEMLAVAFTAINRADYLKAHPKEPHIFGLNSTPSISGVLVPDQFGSLRRSKNKRRIRKFDRPLHPSNFNPQECDFLDRAIQAANEALRNPSADPFDGVFGFRTRGRGGNGGQFFDFSTQIPGSNNTFFGLNK